jgi:16S rRNA (uracil1498-N3)-methyltransferase
MRIPRIFYPHTIVSGDEIILDANSSKHILKVLRLNIGMTLIIFNGKGGEFVATILQVNNHRATVKIDRFIAKEVESPFKIHLTQGIGRGEKMDYVVQKAVELGVHKITPLFTEYCNVKLTDERAQNRISRWQTIMINACEQSGRNIIPTIEAPQNLAVWLPKLQSPLKLLLDHRATKAIKTISGNYTAATILVGPEGGLSEDEILLAQKNGFISVHLGPRVLRTETAALVALSVLQAQWGDF